MSPDLCAMVSAARDAGVHEVWLSTSGLRLALPRFVRELKRAGLTHVLVSIPTTTAPVGDVLLGRAGATQAKLEGIERTLRVGVRTSVVVMLARPALESLPRTLHDLRVLGRGAAARLDLHGCLIDPVPALDIRYVAWGLRRRPFRVRTGRNPCSRCSRTPSAGVKGIDSETS